ncbi:hypothetical protein cyc_08846 [Cyclospora cayetanensis]|uniref:Uncharacterized protein n=1 Tax=Cyclospora cayetanensis TaxID=88456 RepID=A0A1D3D5Z5_9EIME|nr:hypothetical protein cyc_08846 [Cyclospora cayetanensis]
MGSRGALNGGGDSSQGRRAVMKGQQVSDLYTRLDPGVSPRWGDLDRRTKKEAAHLQEDAPLHLKGPLCTTTPSSRNVGASSGISPPPFSPTLQAIVTPGSAILSAMISPAVSSKEGENAAKAPEIQRRGDQLPHALSLPQ